MFLLPGEREGGREMKRILIILFIITISGAVFADGTDVLESNLSVYVNINPDTFGVIKLQDKDGKTTYDTFTPISLTLNSSVQGTGEAYLYYYAIGHARISLEIKSSLKNSTGSGGADNAIDYSIALAEEQSENKKDSTVSFTPSSISSNGTKTTTASIGANSFVRTKGRSKLSFITLDSLQNKNFGTYRSEIVVTYTSTI